MVSRLMFDYEERISSVGCPARNILIKPEGLTEKREHCVVLCEKIAPNVFFIKSGLLFIDEKKSLGVPETLSVTCPTKVFFIPE